MIGSGFITKGLDRILLGMSNLPREIRDNTRLVVVGQDNPSAFLRMARRLGVQDKVIILSGGRGDIPSHERRRQHEVFWHFVCLSTSPLVVCKEISFEWR